MTEDVIAALDDSPWFIKQFTVERNADVQGRDSLTVQLELIDQRDEQRRLVAQFVGVTSLVFNQTSSNLAVVPRFVSLIERGWEVGRYKFTDPANDSLSLLFDEAKLL